jgi:glutathione peroxidase
MHRIWLLLLAGGLWMSVASLPAQDTKKSDAKAAAETPLKGEMKSLKGEKVDLADYRGKVVMIVNTASYCGNTPQYGDLEQLWKKYGEKGFVVLGFPANEFGTQEPGSDAEIAEFCTKNYRVSFPMFSKIVVKGEGKAPLYEYLTSKKTNPKFAGDITWNFEMFLIGRDGKVAARFKPGVKPQTTEIVKAIETELEKKAE